MIVRYSCFADVSECEGFTPDVDAVMRELDREGYEWTLDGDLLNIDGERYVDEYSSSVKDVADEIQSILLHSEIDADVSVEDITDYDDEHLAVYC